MTISLTLDQWYATPGGLSSGDWDALVAEIEAHPLHFDTYVKEGPVPKPHENS